MNYDKDKIVEWLLEKCNDSNCNGFVVGVSGGVDSALTSTLCAHTKKPVIVVGMPINQQIDQLSRSQKHMDWLCDIFPNVKQKTFDLSKSFEIFSKAVECRSKLALANFQSRMRMAALYSVANTNNMLVVGTGNKVEDYGIGFFTKYGDGGVDLSPIANLLKSQVKNLAVKLGVISEITNATPTDGLWEDNRSDEDQIGASYEELEWALQYYDKHKKQNFNLTDRQKDVLEIYSKRHLANKHKLTMPPVCEL